MELEPISRISLKAMYAARLAEERKGQIDQCVKDIYSHVRSTAFGSTNTSVIHELHHPIVVELIPDILSKLQKLFEDSKIEHIEIKNINKRSGQMEVIKHVINIDWS